jgi:anti-anti-sigma factor
MAQVRPPQHLQIDTRQHGDTVLVRLSGEFDLAAEELFDRTLDELSRSARAIVLDLRELGFIDSSGLRALLRAWERSRTDGHDLTFVPGDGQVRHTMELTGLDAVLPMVAEPPSPNGA